MKGILLIGILIIAVIAISGCGGKGVTGELTSVVCNSPYIRHGMACCLDTNENNICDKDEGITLKIEETMHELKKNYTIIIVTHNMQQALRVSDMTAFFNAIEYEDGDGGKVGYLAEFNSTKKIFNSPKEKTTQEYISGKFG